MLHGVDRYAKVREGTSQVVGVIGWGGGEGGGGARLVSLFLFLALSHDIVSLPFMQAMIEEGNYGAEREANIARNNLLLISLGFRPMKIAPLQKDGCAPKRSRGLPLNSPPPCTFSIL